MKIEYEKPAMLVTRLHDVDIIRTSADSGCIPGIDEGCPAADPALLDPTGTVDPTV